MPQAGDASFTILWWETKPVVLSWMIESEMNHDIEFTGEIAAQL